MKFYYLLALVISITGLIYADRKYKVTSKNTIGYVFVSVCFFLCWDIAGIVRQVFFTNQKWVSGINIISPDLPIEEIGFLILFSYVTLLTWRYVCSRTP